MATYEVKPGDKVKMDWGYMEFGPNEMSIISTVPDPPGIRLASPMMQDSNGQPSNSLGKISFNRLRSDGVQEEVIIIQGKVAGDRFGEDTLIGELRVDVRGPGDNDAAMFPLLQGFFDKLVVHVPVEFLKGGNVPISEAQEAKVSRFYSDDGRYGYNVQGDPTPEYPHGRIVQYDITGPEWRPVAILKPVKL